MQSWSRFLKTAEKKLAITAGDTVQAGRGGVRNAKAHLRMYLHKGQQEELYISVNRKTGEKYGPATEWITGCRTKCIKKANVLNAFFIFTCRSSLQDAQ